jgi:hypothetical protein
VPETTVGNIFDNMPLDWELAVPSILLPIISILLKIYRSNHFRYSTELSTCIDLHKERNKSKTINKPKIKILFQSKRQFKITHKYAGFRNNLLTKMILMYFKM